MNNLLIATITRESSTQRIDGLPNRRIKLVKAFSMDETDFMRFPTLTLRMAYGVGHGQNVISRSFASFIDPYQANSRVVEFHNYIFPPGMGISLEVVNMGNNPARDFKIGIAYEFVQHQ